MKANAECGESFVYWVFYEAIHWDIFKHCFLNSIALSLNNSTNRLANSRVV